MQATVLALALLATLCTPMAAVATPLPCTPIEGSAQADVERLADEVRAHDGFYARLVARLGQPRPARAAS